MTDKGEVVQTTVTTETVTNYAAEEEEEVAKTVGEHVFDVVGLSLLGVGIFAAFIESFRFVNRVECQRRNKVKEEEEKIRKSYSAKLGNVVKEYISKLDELRELQKEKR